MSFHHRLLQILCTGLILTTLFSSVALPSVSAQGKDGPEGLNAQTGTTWYVTTTGNDSNSCSSTGSPCATIDGAIQKAASGDTIQVAVGTYTGSGTNVVTVIKSLTISGGWNSTFTTQNGYSTIDGQNARRGIDSYGGISVTISNFIVENGRPGGPMEHGGGIFARGMKINNCIIRNNYASGDGGGVYGGVINISILEGNTAETSGGGAFASLIYNSTIKNNTAFFGGAVATDNMGGLIVSNTTMVQNRARYGGGVYAMHGGAPNIFTNVTITQNDGVGIWTDGAVSPPTTTFRNSIIAGNMGGDCHGQFDVSDHNIVQDHYACSFKTDIASQYRVDPKLSPNTEGSPEYFALLADSPAIDAGDDVNCPAIDQRGVTRPQGSHCDIGAYEADYPLIRGNAGVAGVTLSYIDGTLHTVRADGSGNYSIRVSVNWSGTVIPSKLGYSFTPSSRMYSNFQGRQTAENYIAHYVGGAKTTGVFRPSNGLLYLKNTNDTGFADMALNYGLPGDYPVVGDWDGNGTVTIGIYRNGYFYLRNENTIGFAEVIFPFGQPGDQPVAGDWNGDGIDTIGVFRPLIAQFLLRDSNTEGPDEMSFYLGNVGDVGIAGDWDGDGIDTTGVFRPSNGLLYLKDKNDTGFADVALNYGLPGDQPVTGDWDNDGIDTIGVYRNGQFMLRNSNTIGFAEIIFGLGNPGDMPIAGNWDGLP